MLDNLSKLRWACRRGMLELDVLLGNFLKEVFPSLSNKDKELFEIFLSYSDVDLYAWLLGHEKPENEDTRIIVQLIRNHARSRI